jgi:hypothetical protein
VTNIVAVFCLVLSSKLEDREAPWRVVPLTNLLIINTSLRLLLTLVARQKRLHYSDTVKLFLGLSGGWLCVGFWNSESLPKLGFFNSGFQISKSFLI